MPETTQELGPLPMQQFVHSGGIVQTFGDRSITLAVDGRAVLMVWLPRKST